MNNLHRYWSSLDEIEKERFAERSGLSVSYIGTHLIHRRKAPPVKKLKTMAKASDGYLSFYDLCDFFSEEPKEKQIEEA